MKKTIIASIITATIITTILPCAVNADDGTGVNLNISSSLSLTVNRGPVMLDVVPAPGGALESDYVDAIVSTNNAYGYTLQMDTNHTYLESLGHSKINSIPSAADGISEDTFLNTGDASYMNRWGMSIGGNNSYNAVLASNLLKTTDDEADSDTTAVYFAVKVDDTIPFGTYEAEVTFTAVANVVEPDEGTEFLCGDTTCTENVSSVGVPSNHIDGKKNNVVYEAGSLARAYEVAYVAAGKRMYVPERDHETGEYTGTYREATAPRDYAGLAETEYRFAMQDMSSEICANASVESELKVIDTRDNKTYWIAKLRDGHCWMTEDLDTLVTKGKTFSSKDTDLNVHGTTEYSYEFGYAYNNGEITWSPARDAVSIEDLDSTGKIEGFNTSFYWSEMAIETGDIYQREDYFDSYECNYFTIPRSCYDYFKDSGNDDSHRHMGDYYTWAAAIASNNTHEIRNDTKSDISNNPKNSICPKNWRLPTISYDEAETEGSTNEFVRLEYLYRTGENYSGEDFFSAPLYFNRGGSIGYSVTQQYAGYNSEYWTSTSAGQYSGYSLWATSSSFSGTGTSNTSYLKQVRCVAR